MSDEVKASQGYRDGEAPEMLVITITGKDGKNWGTVFTTHKEFSTGSVGYYGSSKITNPDNPVARYQAGFTLTLIGSKHK
jgi:hypothetical protein